MCHFEDLGASLQKLHKVLIKYKLVRSLRMHARIIESRLRGRSAESAIWAPAGPQRSQSASIEAHMTYAAAHPVEPSFPMTALAALQLEACLDLAASKDPLGERVKEALDVVYDTLDTYGSAISTSYPTEPHHPALVR